MRHPAAVRYRVYALHYEGKTVAEINADPQIAASVKLTGYRLHGNTLTAALRRSNAEYTRYITAKEAMFATHEADSIAQRVIAEAGALDSVTDVARYELAREIKELIKAGPGIIGTGDDARAEDPVSRIERLTRSLTNISRDEAAALRKQLAQLEADNAALRAELNDLRAKLAKYGAENGGEVIAAMDDYVKNG